MALFCRFTFSKPFVNWLCLQQRQRCFLPSPATKPKQQLPSVIKKKNFHLCVLSSCCTCSSSAPPFQHLLFPVKTFQNKKSIRICNTTGRGEGSSCLSSCVNARVDVWVCVDEWVCVSSYCRYGPSIYMARAGMCLWRKNMKFYFFCTWHTLLKFRPNNGQRVSFTTFDSFSYFCLFISLFLSFPYVYLSKVCWWCFVSLYLIHIFVFSHFSLL